MSADAALPALAADAQRVEALRRRFPWLAAGATLAMDPEIVQVAPPGTRRCTGCGGTTHDRRNCPMGQRVPKRCAWCRAIGHVARTCPERPSDVDPDTASMRARANMCRRCRQLGHRMSECPDRPTGIKHCSYCHEAHHQVTTCAKYRADHPGAPPYKRGPAPRHCTACGEQGHQARTCPEQTNLVDLVPAPALADASPPAQAPAAIDAQPATVDKPSRQRCSVCREPGHRIERCPKHTGQPVPRHYVARPPGSRGRTETYWEMRRKLRVVQDDPLENDVGPAIPRPRTRGDCADVPRPCPFVSCRYHLYLEVSPAGGIKVMAPDLEPDQLTESCSLDVADRGGVTLEEVGLAMNLARERIRQIETSGLENAAIAAAQLGGMESPIDRQHTPLGAAMGNE